MSIQVFTTLRHISVARNSQPKTLLKDKVTKPLLKGRIMRFSLITTSKIITEAINLVCITWRASKGKHITAPHGISLVQFLILVEIYVVCKNQRYRKTEPVKISWGFNLFSNRYAQGNRCSCDNTDMNCHFHSTSVVQNVIKHNIACCTVEQLEISGNDPHRFFSGIHIYNVLHLLYKLWCPYTIRTL